MEKENNGILKSVIFLAVGVFVGFIIWSNGGKDKTPDHLMPDGTMMEGETMDMSEMMEQMSASLEGLSGEAFDEAFIDEMIVHHQGAVEMAKMVLASSERLELRDLAQKIIDAQTAEIQMMEAWRAEWFK